MLKFLTGLALALGVAFGVTPAAAAPAGFHAIVELDFQQFWHDQLDEQFGVLRQHLDEAKVAYADLRNADGRVTVRIADAASRSAAMTAVTAVLARRYPHVHIAAEEPDLLVVTVEEAYRRATEQSVLEQSLVVVRKRLTTILRTAPDVRAMGANRIIVEGAGSSDSPQVAALFAAAPALSINLVDDDVEEPALLQGVAPAGETILPMNGKSGAPQTMLAVRIPPVLGGERIRWAQSGIDELLGEPNVSFYLDNEGTAIFANVTRDNPRRRLAIVIDGHVVSAPMIMEPITGGSVQISGVFTAQEAQDLAARLTRGSVPAPLRIIEIAPGRLPR